jgi:predicted dithiol-disulfide oxidoreductase (DUF899 family)
MSDEYAKRREELLEAEIALTEQRERVAEMRRQLPPGPVVEDYALTGEDGPVRLSQLFGDKPSLVVYHFMFGEAQTEPCPMCTMWSDGWDAVAPHVAQRVAFAVCSAAPYADFAAYGRERGWRNLRLLSAAGTSFKSDFESELPNGGQIPVVTVFRRDDDGSVRLAYRGCAMQRDGVFRGVDLLSPVWHFFDLTPEGRGDWMPSRRYDAAD